MELKAELKYPFTAEERAEFITTNNYELSYEVKAVNFRNIEKEIDVQDKEIVTREVIEEIPVLQDVEKTRMELEYDEEGNVITEEKEVEHEIEEIDEEGNVVTRVVTETVQEPVYKEVTYTVKEPVYEEVTEVVTDEEGNEQEVVRQVPKVTEKVTEVSEEVLVFDEVIEIVIDEEGNEQEVVKKVPRTHKETVEEEVYDLEAWGKTEEELDKEEAERIGTLKCTKRVFALMLQELGISYSQLKELVASNEQAQLEWDLCIELQRSNPLIDVFGAQLGITPKQIDVLFQVANGEKSVEELRATIEE